MIRDISVIERIQKQKDRDLEGKAVPPLDPEGVKRAEHCRITFDIIDIPSDPKR